jgi:hypothetical protein
MVWRVNFVGGDLMYGVPIKYKKGILAQTRQILGKVTIDYSAPETDSSIIVTANENAHITQNQQVANNVEMPTHKWASLDGTWVLDGTHYLCPDTADAAVNNEMGWWGKNLAGVGGKFITCDIDPPFVGTSFNQSGSDPSFCLHDGILYLVFVDGDYIKIAIVDQTTMAVTSLLRTISAPGASRPRLIFEPSTYEGQPDLPHVAYVGSDGKVYGYREQYNEDLSIEAITDEIGTGTSIEAVMVDSTFYHFYVADGSIYVRKQGEYASVLITPDSGAITEVWASMAADGRVVFLYLVLLTDGTSTIHHAVSGIAQPTFIESLMELTGSLQELSFWQTVAFLSGSIGLTGSLTSMEWLQMVYSLSSSMSLNPTLEGLSFPAIYSVETGEMELAGLLQDLTFPAFYRVETGSIELTASLQSLSFV